MIPSINIYNTSIPTFPLFVVLGIMIMILLIFIKLKKFPNHIYEENFILPRIVICGLIGYFSAAVFDAVVKFNTYHKFQFSGITFYGGLIGVSISLFLVLKLSKNKTQFSTKEWFDLVTIPFIIFHIFGRIGCFFGGCCYGKETESFLGVNFPDNIAQNIYHNGNKCYPTQLFEVFALIIIILLIYKTKNRFFNYMILYSIARFIIEFFRGDMRGEISDVFSPSQVVSIVIFTTFMSYKFIKNYIHCHHKRLQQ